MPFFVEITNLFSRSAHGSHCAGPVSEKRVAVTVTPAENMMQFCSGRPADAGYRDHYFTGIYYAYLRDILDG
uniref:Uncharacterized protein n=1 Tax=Faecalibaculum rodentium TaxID=1702221 RepID=A0A140DV24_9FIRM|nr:hypothetical protein AALO17_13670 [Faecalibaculum rodentium]